MQLTVESFDLFNDFSSNKLYVFIYALLPMATGRLHNYIQSLPEKQGTHIHEYLCVMCNRTIPSPTFTLYQLLEKDNPFVDYMNMCQLSADGEYRGVLIFVPEDGKNSPCIQTNLIEENKARLLENSLYVFQNHWGPDKSASLLFF
jgi:hypothetical protein